MIQKYNCKIKKTTGAQSVPVAIERRFDAKNTLVYIQVESERNAFSRSALIATGTDCAPVRHSASALLFSRLLILVALFLLIFSCRKIESEIIPFNKVKTFAGINKEFGEPFGLAMKDNILYVSDGEQGKIRRVAKNGNAEVLTDKLNTPSAIAFDKNGDLIVADSGTHTIKKVLKSGEVEIIAGVENQKGFADGDANNALFNAPVGVAAADGKIFIADTYNDKIRVVENGKVSTLAGNEKGFADGEADQAKFNTPCGLAVWKDGKILVADTGNGRLRVVEPTGNTWTLAGNGAEEAVDGSLYESGFVQPSAVTIDNFGVIYVADGNAIRAIGRRIFPFVETISNTKRGFADGDLHFAKFNRPSGLATDEKGDLYIADAENQVVRIFTGAEIGREITKQEIENLRFSPEEFRALSEPRWSYDPPEQRRDIAGTLGEIRGELKDETSRARFHNGLDIAGGYGETARFIRAEKVLNPFAAQNFDTLRELLRMPTLGYIHIRLGRDENDKPFDDNRFQFAVGDKDKLIGLRVPRGAKFEAGEAIGTLNAMNHVHLIAGRSGAEMNALDALILPNIADKIPPKIEKVSLFDENWREIEKKDERINLHGKTRIVARAFDQMDGNSERRRLSVYQLGYQILQNETIVVEKQPTISFARLPDEQSVKFVYAKGSKSGATGETVFNYIVTNEVFGDFYKEDFFDAAKLENGNYVLRVFAADFFGNQTSQDVEITIEIEVLFFYQCFSQINKNPLTSRSFAFNWQAFLTFNTIDFAGKILLLCEG